MTRPSLRQKGKNPSSNSSASFYNRKTPSPVSKLDNPFNLHQSQNHSEQDATNHRAGKKMNPGGAWVLLLTLEPTYDGHALALEN